MSADLFMLFRRGASWRIALALGVWLVILLSLPHTSWAEADGTPPVRSFEDLYSVAVTSMAEWVVGSKGLVLVSFDEGQSWRRRALRERDGGPELQDLDLLTIRFAPDGITGWIGGEDGIIYYTGDAGRSWKPRYAPFSDQNIFRVAPIDAQSACAVGTDGTLLCTADEGIHWNSHRFDQYVDLNDVTFVGSNGWAVGAYRTILCTNDAGEHWHLQRGGNRMVLDEESYFAVAFKDPQHGWVAGLSGEIVYTTDGGTTWQQVSGASRPSLFAISGKWPNLWFGGKRGALLEQTADGDWLTAQISFGDITDIGFAGSNGIAVGLGGTILRTADDGKTWHSVGAE
jgi:photosystem II stability/assembly factor-like uncharacterized protein